MGGDCAESFSEFGFEKVRGTYVLLQQMALILSTGQANGPVIPIGRIAGQFAKPRSSLYEVIQNSTLPSYRGDIINDSKFDARARAPDPDRLYKAYSQSQECIRMLDSIQASDDGRIDFIHRRNVEFLEKLPDSLESRKMYMLAYAQMQQAKSSPLPHLPLFTAHESLHLPYESALVRSHNNQFYASSAHMVWVGERTRNVDGAHIYHVQGLLNPIGVKISQHISPEELRALLDKINPLNLPGKVTCIVRMGAKHIRSHLPRLIAAVQRGNKQVIWMTDPAHGNTVTTKQGVKTRHMTEMLREVEGFVDVCRQLGAHVGGLHLELTATPGVAECVGGEVGDGVTEEIVSSGVGYKSLCDPRLNEMQSLEMAMRVAEMLQS
eukprot:gene29998-36233_t